MYTNINSTTKLKLNYKMINNCEYRKVIIPFFLLAYILMSCNSNTSQSNTINKKNIAFVDASLISVEKTFGDAVETSKQGRLSHFIVDSQSKAIHIFSPGHQEDAGWRGWVGEHAGKWLYAATKAAYRSNDTTLKNNIHKVADYLISTQCENGYIGSYVDSIRFYNNPVNPQKSWDVWNSAYIMSGFLEMHRFWHESKYLEATERMANLIMNTFNKGGKSLAHSGYYDGLAANGIMYQFVMLYEITNDKRYLEFAKYCVADLEKRPGTEIISRNLCKYDVAQIDHGKMYEMIRVLLGISKLYEVTRNDTLLQVVNNAWDEIHDYHLSPLGAPWGGVYENGQHLEKFNMRYVFSPYGYSETCAVMVWFRFNKEMFKLTGDIKYANELEKTAYNGILGAQFPDGSTWTYHSRPNGERTECGPFACCSSSGPIELEAIPEVIYSLKEDGLMINIFTESTYKFEKDGSRIIVKQETDYPFAGKVKIIFKSKDEKGFNVYVRVPEWAEGTKISWGDKILTSAGNEYVKVSINKKEFEITLNIPMNWQVHKQVKEYNYKGDYLFHNEEYFYLKRGPLVYASSIKDDIDTPTKLRFSPKEVLNQIAKSKNETNDIPWFTIQDSITFKPYFIAADRAVGEFKSTWFRIK